MLKDLKINIAFFLFLQKSILQFTASLLEINQSYYYYLFLRGPHRWLNA